MNKVLMGIVLGLMVISIMGAVSAKTLITGKIYNADFSDEISGASVTVSCVHGDNTNVLTATSENDGVYDVVYEETGNNACTYGDLLTVSAVKGDLMGSRTGEIHDDAFGGGDWDLAVVNVPLVPEFGAVAGAATILSALAVFFVVRRK